MKQKSKTRHADFWKRFSQTPRFDCVKMKQDIQAKIFEEIKELSPDERIAYFNRSGVDGRRDGVKEEPQSYGREQARKDRRKWRLYLDTSVFGGYFDTDEGWAEDSQRVIEAALSGIAIICFSSTVTRELEGAPSRVRELWNNIPVSCCEQIVITREIETLSAAYLASGIVGPASIDDTMHVATATVIRADAIVSWNFKHIVRLDRIKGYNGVNLSLGYGMIAIVSPKEIRFDD
jgi:predicted nucleic acid-binding protein